MLKGDPYHVKYMDSYVTALRAAWQLSANAAVAPLLQWLNIRPPGFYLLAQIQQLWDAAHRLDSGLHETLHHLALKTGTWAAQAAATLDYQLRDGHQGPVAPTRHLLGPGLCRWAQAYWTAAVMHGGREAQYVQT